MFRNLSPEKLVVGGSAVLALGALVSYGLFLGTGTAWLRTTGLGLTLGAVGVASLPLILLLVGLGWERWRR
jgi:hypothetical protein